MKNDFQATYAGNTFYAKTQAMADAQVLKYRVQSVIDAASRVDVLSYENVQIQHKNGTLAQFLLSLAPSDLAIVLVRTVEARNGKYTVTQVYDTYQKIIAAYNAEQERIELVKEEARDYCPEAITEMKSYAALTRFI